MPQKSSWGGRRPGAGAKRQRAQEHATKHTITFRVTEEERAAIEEHIQGGIPETRTGVRTTNHRSTTRRCPGI